MPTKGQGIVYPDCVGEAAPTVGWGHGKGGGERNAALEECGDALLLPQKQRQRLQYINILWQRW